MCYLVYIFTELTESIYEQLLNESVQTECVSLFIDLALMAQTSNYYFHLLQ